MEKVMGLKLVLILCVVGLLTVGGFSCRYVMPERSVDYNKGRVAVNLPRDAGNADIDRNVEKSSAMIVTVNSDGKTYLGTDHSPIKTDELRYKLSELAANKPEEDQIVYLSADVTADYGSVVEACDAIRTADLSHVGVMAFSPRNDWPSRILVELPKQPDPSDFSQLKPNPLMLVVTLSPDLRVKLNQDSYGSVNDIEPLSEKLVNIFRERRDEHAYKPGFETRTDITEDERIEKTLTIKADRKIKYGDVAKVINALKGTGARPIILQLDDLSN
jgi:biopolymer transport protein ExbD